MDGSMLRILTTVHKPNKASLPHTRSMYRCGWNTAYGVVMVSIAG